MTEKKVLVFVDGYNLYYSVCDFVQKYLHGDNSYLWYDLFRLVEPHLKKGEIIDNLYYCSAAYKSPGSQEQQEVQKIYTDYHAKTYEEKFVTVMGRFSRSGDAGYCCPHCKKHIPKPKPYKEKETDVNIALKTTVSICRNTHPKIILVSGDTDFEPLFEFATEEQTEMLRLLPPSPNAWFYDYKDPKYLKYPTGGITGEHIQAACFADQVPQGTPEPRRYPEDGGPPSGSAPPPKPPDDSDEDGGPSGDSAPPPKTAKTSDSPDDPDEDSGPSPGSAPPPETFDPSDAPDA